MKIGVAMFFTDYSMTPQELAVEAEAAAEARTESDDHRTRAENLWPDQGSGDDSTDRWQDKSRGVRLGRSVEERGTDQRLGDEVPCPPQPAHPKNPLKIITGQTSHGEWP